jgi:hypothetical protein
MAVLVGLGVCVLVGSLVASAVVVCVIAVVGLDWALAFLDPGLNAQ